MSKDKSKPCPCGTGKTYSECCYPFHKGYEKPETPEQLMRSRYSAYALKNAKYIIATTHPDNEAYLQDKKIWTQRLMQYMNSASFLGLTIIDSETSADESEGFVTFSANLLVNGNDASFTEKSRFVKHNGKWAYISGEFA